MRVKNVGIWSSQHGTMYASLAATRYAWPQRHPVKRQPKLRHVEDAPSPCYGAFGGSAGRTQGFLALGRLDEDLLEYLQDWLHQDGWGFEISTKEPFLSKADWHTFPERQTAVALVPRLGRLGYLRRAPERCVAFAEALRRLIRPRFEVTGEGRLLEEAVAVGRFGSVEAQVQVLDDTWHFMRSHRDGASGMLQLGLTLQGSRYVRFGCHTVPFSSQNSDENVWDDDSWIGSRLVTLPLQTGHVYLATPAILPHGVAYEPHQATVALMFRLALPDVPENLNQCQSDSFHDMAGQLARQLQTALDGERLHLPSLADVKQVESELEKCARKKFGEAPQGPNSQNACNMFSRHCHEGFLRARAAWSHHCIAGALRRLEISELSKIGLLVGSWCRLLNV